MNLKILLLLLILCAATVYASESISSWKPGQKITYEYLIKTMQPQVTENSSIFEITRNDGDGADFTLFQKIDIPAYNSRFTSMEKYSGANLVLEQSQNTIFFQRDDSGKMVSDSVVILAEKKNDSLFVSCSRPDVPNSVLSENDLITSAGALFKTRFRDYKVGNEYRYETINFFVIKSKAMFQTTTIVDSVVAIKNISTDLGTFECYQVKNIMPGVYGYTYYTVEDEHLPIRVELFDPATDQTIQTLTLKSIIK